jgi:hypothetical protein
MISNEWEWWSRSVLSCCMNTFGPVGYKQPCRQICVGLIQFVCSSFRTHKLQLQLHPKNALLPGQYRVLVIKRRPHYCWCLPCGVLLSSIKPLHVASNFCVQLCLSDNEF